MQSDREAIPAPENFRFGQGPPAWQALPSCLPRPHRLMHDLTSAFLLPANRKRTLGARDTPMRSDFVLGRLMPGIFGCLCLIPAHRADKATTAPAPLLQCLNFRSPTCSYSIRLLFLLSTGIGKIPAPCAGCRKEKQKKQSIVQSSASQHADQSHARTTSEKSGHGRIRAGPGEYGTGAGPDLCSQTVRPSLPRKIFALDKARRHGRRFLRACRALTGSCTI